MTNPNFKDSFTTIFQCRTEESFALMFGGGYSVPLTDKLSHSGGFAMGVACRRNTFDATVMYPVDP